MHRPDLIAKDILQRLIGAIGVQESLVATGGPRPNDIRMIDVLWEGQTLTMFAEDVQKRGEEVATNATSE